jgi:NAD(P)-dependent dehydrogenase (short-subunit alcohol dehydrogenase family)
MIDINSVLPFNYQQLLSQTNYFDVKFVMTTLPGIIYNQLFVSLPSPNFDFTGKTVIVTGSNTGLGFEAARHLVRLNAKLVILAVRNTDKGEQAKQSIQQSTPGNAIIQVWELDLSSYDSVKLFATRCNKELDRLDCVIENAAIGPRSYSMMEDNESALTVNIVSTFLLGILLLSVLRRTATAYRVQPCLSFIVSDVHGMASLPERHRPNIFSALNSDKSSSGMRRRYGVTKLLGVLLTREIAARMGRPDVQGVIVNCVNPGFCASDLSRDAPRLMRHLSLTGETRMQIRKRQDNLMRAKELHTSHQSVCMASVLSG